MTDYLTIAAAALAKAGFATGTCAVSVESAVSQTPVPLTALNTLSAQPSVPAGPVLTSHTSLSSQGLELVVIERPCELEAVRAAILAAPALGLDTETTGLDPFTDSLRLVQLATRKRTYVIDVGKLDARALQSIFDGARWLAGHNLKFDLRFLAAAGIKIPANIGWRLSDSMLASQLLSAGSGEFHKKGQHSLEHLVQHHLSQELDKAAQASDWSGELTYDQVLYAARDAAVCLPLKDRLHAELHKAGLTDAALIEYTALPAVAWLEHSGVLLDRDAWSHLHAVACSRRDAAEVQLNAAPKNRKQQSLGLGSIAEEVINWGSPKRVLALLQERGLELENTEESTLQSLLGQDPLIAPLLEYRRNAKLAGTYGLSWLECIHPTTGRFHADYMQLGSDAGRMSCRRPNAQQVPQDPAYRACFKAPEGRALVKVDYSAIEMRIAAEIAGDARLLSAFKAGTDVHRLTASLILGRPETEVTKADRQAAKAVNFGLLYGMGARGLSAKAQNEYGVQMTLGEAKQYRSRFFETYQGLRRWHQRTSGHPVATRTLAGRRRLNVSRFTEQLNSPVQGTGADGLKTAMGLLFETRGQVNGARLVLAVHDELVVEVRREQVEAAEFWLEQCMREGMTELLKRVPVDVESQSGRDWSLTP